MKALLFEHIPDDCEWRKGDQPQAPLAGTQVHCAAAVKALLAYGTYDRYLFLSRQNESADYNVLRSSVLEPHRDRVAIVSSDRLHTLQAYDHLILNTIFVDRIIALRSLLERPAWPIVGTIHSLHGPDTVRNLQSLMLQRDVYSHDALMCSTRSGKAVVEKLMHAICGEIGAACGGRLDPPPFKLPVIPLGIRTEEFDAAAYPDRRAATRARLGISADAVMFLYFGRISPTDKGDLATLLQAFAQTAASAPQSVLVIAGDDSQYRLADALLARAEALGCRAAVRIDANPSYAQKLGDYAAADVFVSPADHLQETFGISVAEAMASGLPSVVSDWDGYRELVTHGESGFLVDTCLPRFTSDLDACDINRSAVTLLAQSTILDLEQLTWYMTLLARQPDRRRRMGEAAKAAARRRFDWREVVREYETLWEGLVEEGRHVARSASPHKLRWLGGYYQQIYSHYPTRFMDDDDAVTLAGEIDEHAFDHILAGTRHFSRDLFAQVADAVAKAKTITVGDLVDALTTPDVRGALVRAHVARGIKFGLLRIASGASADVGNRGTSASMAAPA